MNRKTLIVYCVVAALLLLGVGSLFYVLFFKESDSNEPYIAISDGISAIPPDAIVLFESEKLEKVAAYMERGGAFDTFVEMLPEGSNEWSAIYSLHYSSKNRVSPLLVVSIPEDVDVQMLTNKIERKCSGVFYKKYGDNMMFRSTVPDISFSVYGNFILASESIIVVESSLRHIENQTSIEDDALYGSVSGVKHNNEVLHLNHNNLGKLFSGFVYKDYLKYAGFAQSFADWSTFSVDNQPNKSSLRGKYNASSEEANYVNVLLTQKELKSDIYSLVPNHCKYLCLLSISNIDEYLEAYSLYLESHKKVKDYNYLNVMAQKGIDSKVSTFSFIKSLKPEQISVFAFDIDSQEKRVLAIKLKDSSPLGEAKDSIADFIYKRYIPEVMGQFFAPTSQEKYFVNGDWAFIGGAQEIEYLYKEQKNEFMFNLDDYLSQTPASEHLDESSVASLYFNLNRSSDSLSRFLKAPYNAVFKDIVSNENFECAFVEIVKGSGVLGTEIAYYHEDLATMPTPLRVPEIEQSVVLDNTVVEVFEGPFVVKDFRNGSTNYLEQRDNNDLRLLNSAKKGVWTIKFDSPLCGSVEQIDYLKNGKLQMLFCSGSKMYLLDRLGRKVGKFPVSLGKEVLLGPNVYDFKGNKEYVAVILHTDNTIAMYNLDGSKYPLWNEITLGETIVSLPEMITVGNNRYWVVRTAYQTLIYKSDGTLAAEFTKKRRLKKDTPVEVISSKDVVVTTFDGREMVLNLDNGSFRKR